MGPSIADDEESLFNPEDYFLHRGGHDGENQTRARATSGFSADISLFPGNFKDLVNAPFALVGDDDLFKYLYEYHQGSGFFCILLTEVCYLLMVLFTILFSTFLMTCVDWKSIHDGDKRNLYDAIYPMCSPEGGRNGWLTFAFLVFIIYWMVLTVRTTMYLFRMKRIHDLWTGTLGLSTDVQWVTWQMVIDAYHDRADQIVDSHFIVNRIMRWDNYLIAMLMKNTFGWNAFDGIFTQVLELNVHKSITAALFRDDGMLIGDVVLYPKKGEFVQRLRKSFMMYGVLNLIGMPFVFSALVVWFIYRYVSEYHKNPKAMGLYTFTPLAKWKLRDFNELPHVYTTRLNKAHPKIIAYLAQFTNEGYNIIIKFVSFMLGSMLLILVAVSFFYPDMIISLFITEKPIIFYVGVLGILFAAVQNNNPDEPVVYEPDEKFDELMKALHGTPASWANMSTKDRYLEIRKLFKYKWMVRLLEIVSVLYVPFILMFWLPRKSEDIVDFFIENSVGKDKKLGLICSCASFDAQQPLMKTDDNGEDDVDSIHSEMDRQLDRQLELKVSASMLNFRENYTWDPNRIPRTTVSSHVINQEYEQRLRWLRMQKEQRMRQESERATMNAQNLERHQDLLRQYDDIRSNEQRRSALTEGFTNGQSLNSNSMDTSYTTAESAFRLPFASSPTETHHMVAPMSYQSAGSRDSRNSSQSHDLNADVIIDQITRLSEQNRNSSQAENPHNTPPNEQLFHPSSVPLDINLPFPMNLVDEDRPS